MHRLAWITDCPTPESRQLRPSHTNDIGSQEIESGDAQRFVFTTVRAGAADTVFIFSEIVRCRQVRCRQMVPLRDQRFGFTKGSEATGSAQQTSDTRPSRDTSISKLLAPAQQYLQALREDILPPSELREAWDAFYRSCDPLVRRTVATSRLHRADADDCAQEAGAEIVAKLTRFEYAPNRGSFEAWLRIVVHRAAGRYARRDHRQTAGRRKPRQSAAPRTICGTFTKSPRFSVTLCALGANQRLVGGPLLPPHVLNPFLTRMKHHDEDHFVAQPEVPRSQSQATASSAASNATAAVRDPGKSAAAGG